jgi:hypothetical protein
MTTKTLDLPSAESTPASAAASRVPFGVNEMRLNLRQWLAVLLILLTCALGIPRVWKHVERFEPGPDYRVPYALSNDYWLYQRRLETIADSARIPVLGDSVVWGEYVRPEGTLSHFLNRETGQPDRFVNCGVNGLFPLAMEGLVEYYGATLCNRKLMVHCNLLWMTSPKADLSTSKEEDFNHAQLVPQFVSQIPCYRADTSDRLSAVASRNVELFAWVGHLQDVYLDQRSLPRWTLEEDGGDPPHRPNAWRNPLAQLVPSVPDDPKDDPQRGPTSSRHKAWTNGGASPTHFDWVDLDASLQWRAFRELIGLLRSRGNDVLVVLGPLNEHMVAEDQRPAFRKLRDGVAAWLVANHVAHVIPETLPSELYADASHPLTDGYARLAKRIFQDAGFQRWYAGK